MANFNKPFSVPNDGAWHTIAVLKNRGWFDMTIEVGAGRIALTSDDDETPETGQPIAVGDRWAGPEEGAGYIRLRAEGGVLSGSMSGDGKAEV